MPPFPWKPIDNLPENYRDLQNPELKILADIWQEQKEHLLQSKNLRHFRERLQRQWAIETGILEQVYTLDRGITEILIEKGIRADLISCRDTDKNPELVARIIQDHEEALNGLFDFVKGSRALSTSYIKELHSVLLRNQDTVRARDALGRMVDIPVSRGDYKKWANNPTRPDGIVHEYSPPEQVPGQMEQLITWHQEHERDGVSPEVEAAWLHHRFTQIHPFQDGNGRVARALATLVFIKAGWFPITVTRDDRTKYIDALEKADQGDLSELVALFSGLQKKAFVNALGLAEEALLQERVDQVIAAAKSAFQRRGEALRREWEKAKTVAGNLHSFACKRLEEVASRLSEEIGEYSAEYRFFTDSASQDGPRNYYFRRQIIDAARVLGYFTNTGEYRAWTRLVLDTESRAEILVSFHGIGQEFRGLIAVSACFFRREQIDEGERESSDFTILSDDVFQINYREEESRTRERFERWLEQCLLKGLEIWRKGL
jgi:Fic family protein